MKYIYGPVKSRRLGLSLGLSLTEGKTCNLDCLYCQLGKTTRKVSVRSDYVRPDDILDELKSWLSNNPKEAGKLDYITFSGAGEPTLNTGLGKLISAVRKLSKAKVAVITNSVLLNDPCVRTELMGADLIVPSLDAVTAEIFAKIDRPQPGIKLEEVISGLSAFRKEFKGKVWLEVMLVSGINDDNEHIKKLKEIVDKISPDRVQLNSPVRTTAEEGILPVARHRLEQIRDFLGPGAEII